MADTQIDVRRNQSTSPTRQAEARSGGLDTFHSFRQEMERMLDRFWRTGFGPLSFRRGSEPEPFWPSESSFSLTSPAIDFGEDEKAYHLTVELPGLSEKDINVTLSGDMLVVAGEKREEKQEEEKNYHYSERRFGSFRRNLQLPQHIDRDKIEANFKNGVLAITLPKTSEAMRQQKKIEVKAR